MSFEVLCSMITYITVWTSTVIITVLYIRLKWSNKINEMERIVKEMDWRIATTELKCIRLQEELTELKCQKNRSGA